MTWKAKVFKMQLQKVILGFLWIRNLIWSWNLDGLYVDDGLGTNRSSDTLDSNESVKNTNLMKWILPKIQMVVLERWFFNHWHYSAKEIIFLLFMSNFTSSKQIFSLVFIFFNHFPYHIPNNCLFLCVEKRRMNDRERNVASNFLVFALNKEGVAFKTGCSWHSYSVCHNGATICGLERAKPFSNEGERSELRFLNT